MNRVRSEQSHMYNLEAGPELDALVAEKVMGWKWERNATGTVSHLMPPHYVPKLGDELFPHPKFSTDIAAAWEVVEKLSQHFHLKLNSPFVTGQPWFAGFTESGVTGWNGVPDFTAKGDTAPLAICRAALKAVDGQEKRDAERKVLDNKSIKI